MVSGPAPGVYHVPRRPGRAAMAGDEWLACAMGMKSPAEGRGRASSATSAGDWPAGLRRVGRSSRRSAHAVCSRGSAPPHPARRHRANAGQRVADGYTPARRHGSPGRPGRRVRACRGKQVPSLRCPRNCDRGAALHDATVPSEVEAWEGGARRRSGSQETCPRWSFGSRAGCTGGQRRGAHSAFSRHERRIRSWRETRCVNV